MEFTQIYQLLSLVVSFGTMSLGFCTLIRAYKQYNRMNIQNEKISERKEENCNRGLHLPKSCDTIITKVRITSKTKNIFKVIISVLLAVAVILGACALFTGRVEDGMKTVHPSYSVGAIDEFGEYKESKSSIFTKDSFACADGLEIKVDFINAVTYQVFFYTDMDNFVSATEVYEAGAVMTIPEGASRARVVITPTDAVDDEGKPEELNIFDTWTYSRQLTIRVAVPEAVEEAPADTDVTDADETAYACYLAVAA